MKCKKIMISLRQKLITKSINLRIIFLAFGINTYLYTYTKQLDNYTSIIIYAILGLF